MTAHENAMCESFFGTLECELPERVRFRTPAAARMAIFEFIEGWYNPRRRHSALAYESPARFEEKHARQGVAAPTIGNARAVEPPESTIARGAAISVSPQSDLITPVIGPKRTVRISAIVISSIGAS